MGKDISERQFAHVCGEALVADSFGLEGASLFNTASFFADYLDKQKPPLSSDLTKVCHAYQALAEMTRCLMDSDVTQEFVDKLFEDVTTLQPGNYLLLPGGWSGTPGHAMIYEIKNHGQGGLTFTVYNSGGGLNKHQQQGDLYSSTLTYFISEKNFSEHNFKRHFELFFKKLLNPVHKNGRAKDREKIVNAQVLYEEILPQIAYLGGELIDEVGERDTHGRFISGQLSGTCAQHVLYESIQSNFKNTDDYRRFIYHFKSHVLDQYVLTLKKNNAFLDPQKKSLLVGSIESNLRFLNRLTHDGNWLFTDNDYKKKELARLSGYLSELNQVQRNTTLTARETLQTQRTKPAKHWKAKIAISARNVHQPTTAPLVHAQTLNIQKIANTQIDLTSKDINQDLSNIIQEIEQLKALGAHEEAIKRLESLFFSQLRLPEKLSDNLSPPYRSLCQSNEQVLLFSKHLVALQALAKEIYAADHTQLLGISPSKDTVRQKHIDLHCTMLMLHVVNSSSYIQACRIEGAHFIASFLSDFDDDATMISTRRVATNNPEIDAQYEKLCHLKSQLQSQLQSQPMDLSQFVSSVIKNQEIPAELQLINKILEDIDVPLFHELLLELWRRQQEKEITDYRNDLTHMVRDPAPLHQYLATNNLQKIYAFLNVMDLNNEAGLTEAIQRIVNQDNVAMSDSLCESCKKIEQAFKFLQTFQSCLTLKRKPGEPQEKAWCYSYDKKQLTRTGLLHLTIKKNVAVNVPIRFDQSRSDAFNDKCITSISTVDIDSQIMLSNHDEYRKNQSLIRLLRETQIPLTLEYFTKNIEKLSAQEAQIDFESNLFQPGLLRTQLLTNSASFFKQFNDFLKTGLRQFQDVNGPTQENVFLIRQAFLINQYAIQLDPTKFAENLTLLYAKINELLGKSQDVNIRRDLLVYRLRLLTEITNLQPERNLEFLTENLESCFTSVLYEAKEFPQDIDSQYRFTLNQKKCLNDFLSINASEQEQVLRMLLQKLGFQIPNTAIFSFSYPEASFQTTSGLYQLDLEKNLLFKNGMTHCVMPTYFRNQTLKLMERFHVLPCDHYFYSKTTQAHSIKKGALELLIQDNQSFIKGIEGLNKDKWYQIFSIDHGASQVYGTPLLPSAPAFSACMLENDAIFLVSDDENGAVSELAVYKGSEIVLKGEVEDQADMCFRECQSHRILCMSDTDDLIAPFSLFEPSQYIDVFYHESNRQYDIELKRYGLKFHQSEDDHTISCIYNGEKYELMSNAQAIIDPSVPQLLLKNAKGEMVIILPESHFIPTDHRDPNSHYKRFELDTNDQVDMFIFKQIEKYEVHPWFPKPNIVNLSSWKRTDSKKAFVFSVQNGETVPRTSEEMLYLAYLYLGTHQVDKAWAMLQQCDKKCGGLHKHTEELEYILRLILAVPCDQHSNFCIFEQTISIPTNGLEKTAATLSCQLKALAMLLRSMPDPLSLTDSNLNSNSSSILHVLSRRQKNFIFSLPSLITPLYTELLHFEAEGESVYPYQLSAEERWTLLDYCHNKIPRDSQIASSAMDVAYQELYLQTLTEDLETIKAPHEKLSYQQQQTRNFISQREHVVLPQRIIQETERGNALPDFYISKDNIQALPELKPNYNYFTEISPDEAAALTALTDEMSIAQMFQYFTYYVSIAQNKTSPHFRDITLFSEKVLRSYLNAKSPEYSDRHTNHLRFLASVLYKIAHAETDEDFLAQCAESFSHIGRGSRDSCMDRYNWLILAINNTARELPATPPLKFQSIQSPKQLVPLSLDAMMQRLPPKPIQRQPVPLSQGGCQTSDQFQVWFQQKHPHIYEQMCPPRHNETDATDITISDTNFFASREYHQGKKQYQAFKDLKKQASCLSETDVSTLQSSMQAEQASLRAELDLLEQDIVRFVTNKLSIEKQIDIAADVEAPITMQHLLTLYFQNDIHQYQEKTGLNQEKIETLHTKLIKFVALKTFSQQMDRCVILINTLTQAKTPDAQSISQLELAKQLSANNLIDAVNDPILSHFQISTDKLLRKNQVDALQTLLTQEQDMRYTECVEKIIMGGGKSKIILPTLAQKKADGHQLMMIVVPDSLLRTNYADLRATSLTLFGQDAFLFEFNRNSDCSPSALQQLSTQLLRAIHNKSYMVTSREALQSLELKYLDLLASPPNFDQTQPRTFSKLYQEWQQSVQYLDHILHLFRTRGELVIDEVHEGLLVKNKLNYTLGKTTVLDRKIAQIATTFFQLTSSISFELQDLAGATQTISGKDLLSGAYQLSPQQYTAFTQQVMLALFNRADSPLGRFLKKKTEYDQATFRQLLGDYLTNQCTEEPMFIRHASEEDKKTLSFIKAELSVFLSATLSKTHFVNYGESDDMTLRPAERALAIPYKSNMDPRYGSYFSNELETINFTIQSMLHSGIQRELFVELLMELKQAAKQYALTQGVSEFESPAGRFFHQITGVSIETLDLTLPAVQNDLFNTHQYNTDLIYYTLEHLVLPQLKLEPYVLHADAFSLVDMVHSCQGLSGTPWNSSTFHQRLHHDQKNALGTDGYIVDALAHQPMRFLALDLQTPTQFINQLLKTAYPETRAIIDINATFKGVSNHQVAETCANYFESNQQAVAQHSNNIQYVLFFNQDNQLSALPVASHHGKRDIIILYSTEPDDIQKKLGVSANELFTYYDQSHVIGVDIAQDNSAHAMVLIDENTSLQHFLQGSMRMRGLIDRSQTMDVVMPSKMKRELESLDSSISMPLSTSTCFESMINKMYENEQCILRADNFSAAINKIHNLIRNDLMERVLYVQSEKKDWSHDVQLKKQYFDTFKSFFIDTLSSDLCARFGHIDTFEDTKVILKSVVADVLAQWQAALTKAGIQLSDIERENMHGQMQSLIDNMGICDKKNLKIVPATPLGTEAFKQQQSQHEVEKQLAKQKLQQQEEHRYKNQDHTHLKVNNYIPLSLEQPHPIASWDGVLLPHKEKLKDKFAPFFDDDLYVSANFYRAYIDQDSVNTEFLKPVYAIYFCVVDNKLSCQILTQQECAELIASGHLLTGKNGWVSTTSHHVLAGTPFDKDFIKNKQYQNFITQIRYFNAELATIGEPNIDHSWLYDASEEKISYFEKSLSAYRQVKSSQWHEFKANIEQYSMALESIITTPSQTLQDLKTNFPFIEDEMLTFFMVYGKKINAIIEQLTSPTAMNPQPLDAEYNSYSSTCKRYVDDLSKIETYAFTCNKYAGETFINEFHGHQEELSQINYCILKLLFDKTNMTASSVFNKNHFLDCILAMNEALSGEHLQHVISTAKQDAHVCALLLANNTPAPKVSPEILDEFLTNNLASYETLLLMSQHCELHENQVDRLLKKMKELSLTRDQMESIYINLLTHPSFFSNKIVLILDNIHQQYESSQAYQDGFAHRLRNDERCSTCFFNQLLTRVPHIGSAHAETLLAQFATITEDAKELTSIIEHEACNEHILLNLIGKKEFSIEHFETLMSKHPELLTLDLVFALEQHGKFPWSNAEIIWKLIPRLMTDIKKIKIYPSDDGESFSSSRDDFVKKCKGSQAMLDVAQTMSLDELKQYQRGMEHDELSDKLHDFVRCLDCYLKSKTYTLNPQLSKIQEQIESFISVNSNQHDFSAAMANAQPTSLAAKQALLELDELLNLVKELQTKHPASWQKKWSDYEKKLQSPELAQNVRHADTDLVDQEEGHSASNASQASAVDVVEERLEPAQVLSKIQDYLKKLNDKIGVPETITNAANTANTFTYFKDKQCDIKETHEPPKDDHNIKPTSS